MSLSTTVIVNGINNLSDARYCAAMGVDVVSFNLKQGHEDQVQPETLKEIAGWVAGVQLCGEFENERPEEINQLAEEFKLDLVQLDAPYLIDEIEQISRPVIQKMFVNKDSTAAELLEIMELYSPYVKYFLLYSHDFTAIDDTNTAFLKKLATHYPILVGFGLGKENIKEVLEKVKPAGIGLQGGHEEKPGFKDFDELQDIFEEIEID
ncbi:phosphoribosylanthranilate isomerase [Pontibacter arcticus]|uniref:N-(5'-phosphoribosyl)anthranilate isomerase n=1 Tax=Pontibacter arcticus TaxID=2080288 RepID=A0A364RGM3_9BACT|nr:hypothetical protein [Pontibacter arcticus]RAU83336.1 hypothetical protein DP923_09010 [Pontibacter arcticus]